MPDGMIFEQLRSLGDTRWQRISMFSDSKIVAQSSLSWRVIAPLVLVVWGALAFGAVYPWAYLPLFTAAAVVGIAAFFQRSGTNGTDVVLAASLVLVVAVIGVQLIPLPVDTIRWLTPETDVFLRRYVVGYPMSIPTHSLSIDPPATAVALGASLALGVLFLGLARVLTHDDAIHIAQGVTAVGVVMALAGIIQKATWNGKIYGFWTPIQTGDSFGPFVNRNHFAGWMLMALPLAVGYFCGRVSRSMRQIKPGLRNRVLWFSSRDANATMMAGFAVLLMALALTLTMSRSGILGLLAALLISSWLGARRHLEGSCRTIVMGYLVFVVLLAIGWAGFDNIATRFAQRELGSSGGRLEMWADSWRLAQKFPITGSGVNTFGSAMLLYQTMNVKEHLAQAHNDYLQLLAEGGALVCIPAGLAVLAFVRVVRARFGEVPTESRDYWIRNGAVTGILAIALQEIADFSLQMPGNAVLFVVLVALAARRSPRGSEKAA